MLLLALVSRLVIGGLLLFGGATKLSAGDAFRRNWLSAFVKLPESLRGPAATAFSLLELAVGSAFILGLGNALSALAASLLLAAVSIVAAGVLISGRRPSCGCAGEFSSSRLSWRLVARNTLFIGVAGLIAASGRLDPGLGTTAAPIGLLAWAATAAMGYLAVDRLAKRRSRAELSAAHPADRRWRLQKSETVEG